MPRARVHVAAVQRDTSPVLVEPSGTIRAVRRATLAAKVAGPITGPALALGQAVRTGDALLTISAPQLSARTLHSKAQLAQVERELVREQSLFATGAGTSEAVKLLQDQVT